MKHAAYSSTPLWPGIVYEVRCYTGEHDLQAMLTTCSLANGSIVWRISRLQVSMSTRVKTVSITEVYGLCKDALATAINAHFPENVRV